MSVPYEVVFKRSSIESGEVNSSVGYTVQNISTQHAVATTPCTTITTFNFTGCSHITINCRKDLIVTC